MEPKLLTAERFVDIRTGCMYRYVQSDTEYFRPHYHDYCEIFLVLEGHAIHYVNHTQTRLSPRDLVFIRPSDTHDYVSEDGTRFSMLNITFTHETMQEIFSFLGGGFPSGALLNAKYPPSVRLTAGEFHGINTKMAAISTLSLQEPEPLKTAIRMLLFELFTKYFSGFQSKESDIPQWLETLCAEYRKGGCFIEGSEKLFSMTDKSREHVCRSMKRYMGVTVSEFINELRLNYISNMLLSSNHTITEIILESGFNNLSWASELFKARHGMTMRDFRSAQKQQAAKPSEPDSVSSPG